MIRKLAKAGKTMIIVTHEMRLAKEIANRVFFLTDGILYEEGSPEQIFNDPQKEKTLNFINCVNEKRMEFTPKHFEFITCMTTIGEFSERNDLPPSGRLRVESVYEEMIAINLLPILNEKDLVKVRLAYSEVTKFVTLHIAFPNLGYDPLQQGDEHSLSLIRHHAERITFIPPKEKSNDAEIIIEINT